MQTNRYFLLLLSCLLLATGSTFAQTANFDETWKEFLLNNKISDMSALPKPNKNYKRLEYAKYLLMNTNNSFCQSEMEKAETLMAEIQEMDPGLHEAIPGFIEKKQELKTKMEAYYSMDALWQQFLQTQTADLDALEAVEGAKSSCEKQTLAKYSYMTAYQLFCEGNTAKAKNIFETRTLRLAEKTSLRVADVEGLAPEVAKMKKFFQLIDRLDVAWNSYLQTGESPGFKENLPVFLCNPTPNMQVFVLNGMANVCEFGPDMLEEIKALQTESGLVPEGELAEKIKALELAIVQGDAGLVALNEAWESFLPDNKVKSFDYGYEYCKTEPLIRAYIMDGFAYVCDLAEDRLEKIETLMNTEQLQLDDVVMQKISELVAINEEYKTNAVKIEKKWNDFVASGDRLRKEFESKDYCDNIHQVKDWTMQGLSGSCEAGHQYLTAIEEFEQNLGFDFTEDLECRVQKLRIKVWDCRRQALLDLAEIQAPEAKEARLAELMEEYGMGERPEGCLDNE